MTVQEDVLAEQMTKIIGGPGQGDINNLESEVAKRAAKILTKDDIVEKGCKYGFLVVVLGST